MKRFKTISEFMDFRGSPPPAHPLICVFPIENMEYTQLVNLGSWCYDFYVLALKRVDGSQGAKLKYGQQSYDYDNGIMSCVAPGQVISVSLTNHTEVVVQSGWTLLVHPDFLWNTPLSQTIRQYDYWDYSVHEALFLSDKEEDILIHILQIIEQECRQNVDRFTKSIVVSHLETLLNYADRFYNRQFLTREKVSHEVLERLEQVLNTWFDEDSSNKATDGLPTVVYLAQQLHLSPKYLSSLLKTLTGLNTQQHIHEKLIEKAKEKLTTTHLTVSEIAYQLGFEHLQSFSKLFKNKTSQSPMEFRESFQ